MLRAKRVNLDNVVLCWVGKDPHGQSMRHCRISQIVSWQSLGSLGSEVLDKVIKLLKSVA